MSFYYNSALTTFKISQGEYFPPPVEKSIFLILKKIQDDMRRYFKNNLKEILFSFVEPVFLEDCINKIYCGKENQIPFSCFNFNDKNNPILKKIPSLRKLKKINMENFYFFLLEIKNYCKSLTIQYYSEIQFINFFEIAKEINFRVKNLKELFLKVPHTNLDFNYINKKKLQTSFSSFLITYVKFYEKNHLKEQLMDFKISKEILSLLLMPERYSKLNKDFVVEMKGVYTLRMYKLLEEHMKKKKIELTKEELFNFFTLPNSYKIKTHLIEKMLIPTFNELEKITGIKAEVTFYPENKWETVTFSFKKISIVKEIEKIDEIAKKANTLLLANKSFKIDAAIEKMRRNIFVSKAWDKAVEAKIADLIRVEKEELVCEVLEAIYVNLKSDVKKSLAFYIQGVVKKMKIQNSEEMTTAAKSEKKKSSIEIGTPIPSLSNNLYELVAEKNKHLYGLFETFDSKRKLDLEQRAKEKYLILTENEIMNDSLEKGFQLAKKSLIPLVLNELIDSSRKYSSMNL